MICRYSAESEMSDPMSVVLLSLVLIWQVWRYVSFRRREAKFARAFVTSTLREVLKHEDARVCLSRAFDDAQRTGEPQSFSHDGFNIRVRYGGSA